jgi:hypothetical protein
MLVGSRTGPGLAEGSLRQDQRRARPTAAAVLLALALVTGCGEPETRATAAAAAVPSPPFDSLFELEATIGLQEPDSGLITRVATLDVDARGRLLVPEPALGEVRVYDPGGRLLRRLGRRGDGPGEFRRPLAAAFGPDGSVYVTDAGIPRVTRFAPSLAFDTIFPLQGAYFGAQIGTLPDGLVVFAMREGPDARLYDLYTPRGRLQARFHALHPLVRSVPGWIAAARSRLAVGAGHIFVAESLLYPLARYTAAGEFVDSLGTPPPSWRPASRPEPGAFEGAGAWARFQRWRRTFTTIAALGVYRDSLLLVVHEALDPDVLAYEEAEYRLDLYRIGPQVEKIARDVMLPGPLLHAGDRVYLRVAGPPEAVRWTLGRYRLRGAERHVRGIADR